MAEVKFGEKLVTVGDLMRQCNVASDGMSVNNPNRMLLVNCVYTMKQLLDRIELLENPKKVM